MYYFWREEREAKASSKSVLHLDYSQIFQKGPRCTIFERTIFEPIIFESEYKMNSFFLSFLYNIWTDHI